MRLPATPSKRQPRSSRGRSNLYVISSREGLTPFRKVYTAYEALDGSCTEIVTPHLRFSGTRWGCQGGPPHVVVLSDVLIHMRNGSASEEGIGLVDLSDVGCDGKMGSGVNRGTVVLRARGAQTIIASFPPLFDIH